MNILLVAINSKYIHSNLAVYSLKSYANKYYDNADINIAEYTINNLAAEILDGIYLKKPDILAFSCYIWNIDYVKKIVNEIKKILPDVKIWLGGPEAYYNCKSLMDELNDISLIMKGEGEETFKELIGLELEGKADDESLSKVRGITYRNSEQKIVENVIREPINMSDIPFPYNHISDFRNKIIYYESSRGCPFSCSYCLSSVEKSLRFRDVEIVKKELKFFMDNGVSQVKFVDRTFNCKKSHAMEIWKFILENDNGITNFHFEVAADLITDDEIELISKMRRGLIQLEIGVQSTNAETIKEIRRVMDLDKVRKIVARINEVGNVHQHLDLIAGLPFENIESFKNSFNEVYRMEPGELQLGFLKVLSGSYMFEKKEDYDIKYKNFVPYEVLSTKWISYDDVLLLKGVEEMVEVYYNSMQFPLSIKYLEKYFATPFAMYYSLSLYYEKKYDAAMKHSRISRYNILLDFVKDYFGNVLNEDKICVDSDKSNILIEALTDSSLNKIIDDIRLLMTFDIYLRENAKSRPEFAKDMSVYRDEIKEFAKTNALKRDEHIEVLSEEDVKLLYEVGIKNRCVVVEGINHCILAEGRGQGIDGKSNQNNTGITFVSFDYSEINPVNHQCKIIIWR